MSPDVALLVVSTSAGVLAVVVVLAGDRPPAARRRRPIPDEGFVWPAPCAAALVVLAASGWAVAAIVVAVGMLVCDRGLAAPRRQRRQ